MPNQIKFNGGNILENQCVQASENRDRDYATAMFVRFTSYHKRVACGEVKTLYMGKVFYFRGLDHLLLIMEDVMDFISSSCAAPAFPQGSFQYRGIRAGKGSTALQETGDEEMITEFDSEPELQQADGCFATITIYYRQHTSIQGELRIAGQKILFRSSLELMRLLHQALKQNTIEMKIPKSNPREQ